jgi:hypothetical protein
MKGRSGSIASQIMFLLLLGNVSDMLFDLFPNFLYDEMIRSYNSFNYKITLHFLIQQEAIWFHSVTTFDSLGRK